MEEYISNMSSYFIKSSLIIKLNYTINNEKTLTIFHPHFIKKNQKKL